MPWCQFCLQATYHRLRRPGTVSDPSYYLLSQSQKNPTSPNENILRQCLIRFHSSILYHLLPASSLTAPDFRSKGGASHTYHRVIQGRQPGGRPASNVIENAKRGLYSI